MSEAKAETRAERLARLRRMVEEGKRREAGIREALSAAACGDREIRLVVCGVEFSPLLTLGEGLRALALAHARAEKVLQGREAALEEAIEEALREEPEAGR